MSALTKIFVALLVLVSVAFTAGVITFINQLAPLSKNNVALKDSNDALAARVGSAEIQLATAAATAAQADTARVAEVNAAVAENAKLRQQLADRDAQIARLNSSQTIAGADISRMTAALAASEEVKAKYAEQIAAARTAADALQKQNIESSNRISDLTRVVDVTERERRNLAEQVTELTNRSTRQARLLKDMGATDEQIASGPAGTGIGAPAINGIIRERKTIAGKEYATISIGAEDAVVKGMQFKILEKGTGRFLGVLTIDNVDSNEAIGRIESDNTAAIKAGAEVRTQV